MDSGEISQVIDDGFARVNVVVDERALFVLARATEDGDSSEGKPRGSDDLLRAVGSVLVVILKEDQVARLDRRSAEEARRSREIAGDGRTSCIATNSASMAMSVPGLGSSSGERFRCLTSEGSRFLFRRKHQKKEVLISYIRNWSEGWRRSRTEQTKPRRRPSRGSKDRSPSAATTGPKANASRSVRRS
jgi:hypothetical protein